MKRSIRIMAVLLALFIITVIAPVAAQDAPAPVSLTLVGYAVPREAFGEIIPAFQAKWLKEKQQQVQILESYGASGSQSRAVAGGFEADIVDLSIEPDVQRLVDAKRLPTTGKPMITRALPPIRKSCWRYAPAIPRTSRIGG